MTKIFVYAANNEQAEKAVETLKSAGAEHVEWLESLKLSTRQPKENRYLFICETPAEKLAGLVQNELPEKAYAEVLEQWYTTQSQILEAYQSQKKGAFLISLSSLDKEAELIRCINKAWGLNLSSTESTPAESEQYVQSDILLAYLVQNLIQQTPPLHKMAEAIADSTGDGFDRYSESEAISAYRKVKQIQSINRQEIESVGSQLIQLQRLQEESEVLLIQLHQSQNELERIYQEYQTYRDSTDQEKEKLTADIQRTQAINQNLQEESGLILLQLHQVQEELERNFLELQETKVLQQQLQNSWERVFKKNPYLFDYQSVDFAPIGSDKMSFKWIINDLQGAGVSRKIVSFETFVENNVLGIRFNKEQPQPDSGLTKWPYPVKEALTVELIPTGISKIKTLRANTLRDLSTSDWQLIKLLPLIILDSSRELEYLVDPTVRFRKTLESMPDLFRYDSVTVVQNVVNPDYEHIWLKLHNVSLGKYQLPTLEFRIAAANVIKNGFSFHPKLEIPLIDSKAAPFSSWFEESKDEFGVKFELRFDTKTHRLDTAVWNRLENDDKNLLIGLINSLPAILNGIHEGLRIKRPQQEWSSIVETMNSIIHSILISNE